MTGIFEVNKTKKIWITDVIIILVIIIALAGVWNKYAQAHSIMPFSKPDSIQIVFYCESGTEVAADQVKLGDLVQDSDKGVEFGHVIDVKVGKSVSYGTSDKGEVVQSPKPKYASVYITVIGNGLYSDGKVSNGITFDNIDYWIGMNFSFKVGNAAFFGRIDDVEKRE